MPSVSIKSLSLPVIAYWFPTISIILANPIEDFFLSGILLNCSYAAEAAATISDTSLPDTQFSKQLCVIGTSIILVFTKELSKNCRSYITYSGSSLTLGASLSSCISNLACNQWKCCKNSQLPVTTLQPPLLQEDWAPYPSVHTIFYQCIPLQTLNDIWHYSGKEVWEM